MKRTREGKITSFFSPISLNCQPLTSHLLAALQPLHSHLPVTSLPLMRAHLPAMSLPLMRAHLPAMSLPLMRAHLPAMSLPLMRAHLPAMSLPLMRAHLHVLATLLLPVPAASLSHQPSNSHACRLNEQCTSRKSKEALSHSIDSSLVHPKNVRQADRLKHKTGYLSSWETEYTWV